MNKLKFSSLCHLDNPLLLKDVEDADIAEVEIFVRENLFSILTKKKICGECNMIDYFGDTFSSNPDQFKFRIGDKKLLKIIISHVKKTVEDGNVEYFKSNQTKPGHQKNHSGTNETPMTDDAARTYYFLNLLSAAADINTNRKRGGYRYDVVLKRFATLLRIISGPLAYSILQNNLKCALPSLPSTNRYIQATKCKIVEGVLRSDELKLYLTSRKLPLIVSISEDATRIIGRVQYDSGTNQLIGFILPINQNTGMPIPFAFPARNAEDIFSHFEKSNKTSSYLTVIMAQPLANVAPFCLLVYGSNNKIFSNDVINRWKFVTKALNDLSIEVLTISSDSDTRYNSAMRRLSRLATNTPNIIKNTRPFYVQDTVHIGTKLRNFFLQTVLDRKKIPFGNCFIRLGHLIHIIANYTKDNHHLTLSAVNPTDRQNFQSVQSMYDERVIELLKNRVEGGEGTAFFLEIVRDIIDSYLNTNLMPLERVQKIWFALYVIRIWRMYVLKSRNYNLKNNFMSIYCYVCVELNAHSLVQIIQYLGEINRPDLFLPHLYGSQQCENAFRELRSFTPTYSTVTNCSPKEALSRIGKIQLIREIIYQTAPKLTYARLNNYSNASNVHKLPSEHEISEVISKCKKDAINAAIKFNILRSRSTAKEKEKATSIQIQEIMPKPKKKQTVDRMVPMANSLAKKFTLSDLNKIALKDYAVNKASPIDETSPYIEFGFGTKRKVIKKMSMCWLLQNDIKKLSNDRLRRVRADSDNANANSKLQTNKNCTVSKNKCVKFTVKRKCKY